MCQMEQTQVNQGLFCKRIIFSSSQEKIKCSCFVGYVVESIQCVLIIKFIYYRIESFVIIGTCTGSLVLNKKLYKYIFNLKIKDS